MTARYVKDRADFARLVIMYVYGGIYLDTDVILLRELWCAHARSYILDHVTPYQRRPTAHVIFWDMPHDRDVALPL